MMRIGCSVDLFDKGEMLRCKDAGAAFIAGEAASLAQMPSGERTELLSLLRRNGMELAVFYGLFPKEMRVTGEWVDDQKISSYLPDVFDRMSLFCPEVLLLRREDVLPKGKFPDVYIVKQTVYLIKKHILPLCTQYRIKLAVEPMEGLFDFLKKEGLGAVGYFTVREDAFVCGEDTVILRKQEDVSNAVTAERE